MERLTIEDMKQIELELMDELDRICREQGITYYIAYGSLLGAARHGGFIPWDDDLDVVMMRADYERLMEVFDDCRSSNRFKIVSYRDGESIFQFAKLTDDTTRVKENFIEKSRSNGVWVDIFPLDFVDPSDTKKFARVFNRNARWALLRNLIVTDPGTGSNGFVKLAKRIICPFVKGLDPVKYAKRMDDAARTAWIEPKGMVADIVADGRKKMLYPVELFEPMEMKFEDRTYIAPKGYEEYLSIQYGDWQTPPPEDRRFIHTFEAYRL